MGTELRLRLGLSPERLVKLQALSLGARRVRGGAQSGVHRSRRRGSSIEFNQHKAYTPGDDTRHIDWRAFAKSDRFVIKQFEDENRATWHIVLDTSASMNFAEDGLRKLDIAKQVAAAIAFVALNQHDALSLAGADQRISLKLPPRSSAGHLNDILRHLEEMKAEGASDFSSIADDLLASRKLGHVIYISDFLSTKDDVIPSARRLAARARGLSVFHILSETELSFPFESPSLFSAMEYDKQIYVLPRRLRNAYIKKIQSWRAELQTKFSTAAIDYHLIKSVDDVDNALMRYFALSQRK